MSAFTKFRNLLPTPVEETISPISLPSTERQQAVLLSSAMYFARKYAATKARWYLTTAEGEKVLDPLNHEADKMNYEQLLDAYRRWMEGGQ